MASSGGTTALQISVAEMRAVPDGDGVVKVSGVGEMPGVVVWVDVWSGVWARAVFVLVTVNKYRLALWIILRKTANHLI